MALQGKSREFLRRVRCSDDLVKRGVSRARAKNLVARFPEAHIREKLEEFDFRMAREEGDPLRPANPGGYLAQAIDQDYAKPKGFKSKAELEQERLAEAAAAAERKARKEAQAKAEEEKQAKREKEAQRKTQRVEAYLVSLSEARRKELEEEVLGSTVFGRNASDMVRATLIANHVLQLLGEKVNEV